MPERRIRRPTKGPRVAVAQITPALGDVEANLRLHQQAVERARSEHVDILVFPELSLTGYRLRDMVPEVATARNHPVLARLAALSQDVSCLVGLVEETPEHAFFNAAAFFEGGHLLALHHKVYLPTYGMFDEQRYFARGHRVAAFNSRHGKLAVLICEDMLHPTALMIAALDGASTVFVPSASPARGVVGSGDIDANARHWQSYNKVMARNLGVYIVYANRAGVEDGHVFWGGSEIVGPSGELLARAAYYADDFITALVPEEALRRRRIHSPVLRDEDIDLTINELARLRGRVEYRPLRERPRAGGRGRAGKAAGRDYRGGAGKAEDQPAPRLKPERGSRKPRPVETSLAVLPDKDSK